jgi:hypothetical protein
VSLGDALVDLRERLIAAVLRIGPETLNSPAQAPAAAHALPPDRALTRAMQRIKAEGMDERGAQVDYPRLRASAAYADFHASLAARLINYYPAALASREARLAFWINLYNVLVLDAAIAFGVRRSVTEGRLGVLAFFRRAAYTVGGRRISANDIEHGILRRNRPHWSIPGPAFGPSDARLAWAPPVFDPRIHFALNCASRSCPAIGVYDVSRIDEQLDVAARHFVEAEVIVDPLQGRVRASKIFSWYQSDFGGRAGLISLWLRYLPEGEGRDWLAANAATARFTFSAYDWSLNGKEPLT